uniref:Uncharacterized protein n=1 Tax=Rhizophora mucronata TaxID=61149 RepID=A0A2P2R594_RHIMU
MSFYCWKLI